MYQVGDYVIYKRDVCLIKDIVSVGDDLYYKLCPVRDDSLVIRLPISKGSFLRYPLSKEEALQLIDKISSIEPIDVLDKLLESTYRDLMKSNKHDDLIKIIKTTYLRNEFRKKQGKKQADKDLVYFEKAEGYLYDELSISLGISVDEVRDFIISKMNSN